MMNRVVQKRLVVRHGFTLVELLIVIGILVTLLTITALSVNFVQESDRVAGAARQVQSFMAGAVDRAIYSKKPVGVRLFLDSEDDPAAGTGQRRTISTLAYIDPGQLWEDGAIQLHRWDPDFDGRTDSIGTPVNINSDGVPDNSTLVWMVAGLKANKWWELKRRGLLVDGTRIRIPAGPHGTWYPVDTRFIDVTVAPTATQYLVLEVPYADPGDTDIRQSRAFELGGPETYELELPPSLLPNEPALLPDSVVIDLDGSRLPPAWRPSALNGANFSQFMDIVFSPRGNVIGDAASAGIIHLYICDKSDGTSLKQQMITSVGLAPFEATVAGGTPFVPADEIDPANTAAAWIGTLTEPGTPWLTKDRRLVTLFTQTGAVSVNQINPTDVFDPADLNSNGNVNEPDGIADDPYRFAETGEEGN
ncbi:MAG: prepilin-type N-terminal cleavage/methylation domain-containing protein [Planctomycetaceae bacterium]